ncbi:MAG: hypothetical protein ACK55I_17485, partial [bacterium]
MERSWMDSLEKIGTNGRHGGGKPAPCDLAGPTVATPPGAARGSAWLYGRRPQQSSQSFLNALLDAAGEQAGHAGPFHAHHPLLDEEVALADGETIRLEHLP